jgi:hypothetical protein
MCSCQHWAFQQYLQIQISSLFRKGNIVKIVLNIDHFTVTLRSTSRSRAAVARRAHNPKVAGSIPAFATKKATLGLPFLLYYCINLLA